jgi:hypothetical protein
MGGHRSEAVGDQQTDDTPQSPKMPVDRVIFIHVCPIPNLTRTKDDVPAQSTYPPPSQPSVRTIHHVKLAKHAPKDDVPVCVPEERVTFELSHLGLDSLLDGEGRSHVHLLLRGGFLFLFFLGGGGVVLLLGWGGGEGMMLGDVCR